MNKENLRGIKTEQKKTNIFYPERAKGARTFFFFGELSQSKNLRGIKKPEQKHIKYFTPSGRIEQGTYLIRYLRVKS